MHLHLIGELQGVPPIKTTYFPHHPSVVHEIKHFDFNYQCACGQCIPFQLHSVPVSCSFLTAKPALYSASISCIHLSTAQLRQNYIIPQAPFFPFYPSPFPSLSSGMFYFLRRIHPGYKKKIF